MRIRFTERERQGLQDGSLAARAQATQVIVGTPALNLLAKSNATRSEPPLVYCASGQTLSHPPSRTPRKPRVSQLLTDTPHSADNTYSDDPFLSSEFLAVDNVQSPRRSGAAARAAQSQAWTTLISDLVPVFMDLLYRTSSLRDNTGLRVEAGGPCACYKRDLRVAVVRWAGM